MSNRRVTLTGPPEQARAGCPCRSHVEGAELFADGVCFVPLAAVPGGDQILWTIAEHLNFQFEPRGDPLEQMLYYLGEKTFLIVLDNFEHLIAGGGLLTEILRAAPGVKMLVTSRERLGLYGEVIYPLAGLALPDEDQEAMQSDAVELFSDRAQSVTPNLDWKPDDWQQAVRICRLVEGIPLGIELAATWVDTLAPGEIADEIEHNLDILVAERQDVPPSQRSIRAAFDRSWNLLDESQRAAFRGLAVFRGGFTREAGQAVAGIGLSTLHSLVNKSLLRRDPQTGRYDIHEILRYYAEEQLELSGEAKALYQIHAAYFADFMAERWPHLKDHRQKQALQEMEADFENARATWAYWIRAGEVAQLKKFFHSFWVIYDIRGWYPAGIELFEQAVRMLRAIGTEEAEVCLGWVLAVQGLFSVPVEDYDKPSASSPSPQWMAAHGLYGISGLGPQRGFTLAQEGIQILRRLGQSGEVMIIPLISLFLTASQLIEEETVSLQAAQECLDIATEIDDQWAIAKAKQFLAIRAIEDGRFPEAERLADEALASFEANRDYWSSSVVCIEVLALLAITLQQYENAKAWIHKGLQAAEEIDFKYSIQTAYWQLGFVAALEENYTESARYWRKALAVSDRMLGARGFIGFGRRQGPEWGGRKLIRD